MTTLAEARTRLESMLAHGATDDTGYELTTAEIDDLLRLSAIADRYGVPSSYRYPVWAAATVYAAGDVVRKVGDPEGRYFVAGDAGTSGATEPTWPAAGATVVDNVGVSSITWTAYADAWDNAFDLNRGASEGWLRKAGKVAARFDFSQAESQRFDRSQLHKHCIEQHRLYKSRIHGVASMGVADPYAVYPAVLV